MREEAATSREFALTFADKIKAAPVVKIPQWAMFYYRAWLVLEHDRSLGQGGAISRIHYSAISRYARDHGIFGAALQRLIFFVTELDEEYLSVTFERLKRAAQQ